ncbi:hypothetical protein BsIDN1_24170 [Bacillus safensis]|uniref:Uncharacterized protein n=1 Tax=Bacillus safensis TaxID=561879 RepID=A0A5S9MA09_BACIA|nr:hypothetical protein BsIDN1_24170 [Bacillus safensis]
MFWGKKGKMYAVTSLCVKMNVLTEEEKKRNLNKNESKKKKARCS